MLVVVGEIFSMRRPKGSYLKLKVAVRHPFRGDVSYPLPASKTPLFGRFAALYVNRAETALTRAWNSASVRRQYQLVQVPK